MSIHSANQIVKELKVEEILDLNNAATGPQTKIRSQIKTASYTIKLSDSGTTFFTTGAGGAVTFTLPTPVMLGFEVTLVNTVNQNMGVTATSARMITYNDDDATTATFQTGSHKWGAVGRVYCDGTKYIFAALTGHTLTVA